MLDPCPLLFCSSIVSVSTDWLLVLSTSPRLATEELADLLGGGGGDAPRFAPSTGDPRKFRVARRYLERCDR